MTKREMGVFEYKDGEVTPKAFFGIDGADYRTGLTGPDQPGRSRRGCWRSPSRRFAN